MKILEFKRSRIRLIVEFRRIPNGFPNQGGAMVPIQGHARWHHPGSGGPLCGGVAKGAAPGSGIGGGGGGADYVARPLPPLRWAEYASIIAGQTPGVTDQDLWRLEAWLGNRRHLAGLIRAVIAGLLPQALHRSRGRGGASC
jgi:hypothetical protein